MDHYKPSNALFLIVDFSETDNCIDELKKISDETPNIDNKPCPIYMKKEDFMLNFNMTLYELVKSMFNLHNNNYNLELTDDDIDSICKDFIQHMHNIRSEQANKENPGIMFKDVYDNKITKYIKENNNKNMFIKLILSNKYTFLNITECFLGARNKFSNKDGLFRVFMRV